MTSARTGVTPAGADHLRAGDQRADPVGQVDQLGTGDTGEKVLVAAGEADDLVRKHRADDDRHVRFGDMAVDAHLDRGVRHQTTGELGQAIGTDRAQGGERLRQPRLVVEDRPAGIAALRAPGS